MGSMVPQHDDNKPFETSYHRSKRYAHDSELLNTRHYTSLASSMECDSSSNPHRSSRRRRRNMLTKSTALLSLIAATTPAVMAQNACIPLAGTTMCPGFNSSSVSTSATLVGLFPFLAFVSDVKSFDERMSNYIATQYAQTKYRDLLGCTNVDLANTTYLYARYTASVICNGIIQNSVTPCTLSRANSRPLCADACALHATSEQEITANDQICAEPRANSMDQIRADFTVCALPADSLSGTCVTGADNEKDNCGYAENLVGLCTFCAGSSPNATDSCCTHSNLTRCGQISIQATSSLPPLFPTATTTVTATSTAQAAGVHSGLSGGTIAGIVIGSIIGAALILGLLIFLCLRIRSQRSQRGSVFNQPSPPRKGPAPMAYNPGVAAAPRQGYEVLPGGRIARMSALEGTSGDSPPRDPYAPPAAAVIAGGTMGAGAAAVARGHRHDASSSDEYGDSPESITQGRGLAHPPATLKRGGSLSSNGGNETSPNSGSGGDYSSPQGMASQQSEQLPSFKDYYSQDEIHPNDKVATLWAYQPRANDEFELERGDMLKVVGIWDDGWATGVRLNERAEDWDAKKKLQRDSGVSNGSGRVSPPPPGEIKAFPLVCVCLPDHWKKTIEGDGAEDPELGGSPPPPPPPPPMS